MNLRDYHIHFISSINSEGSLIQTPIVIQGNREEALVVFEMLDEERITEKLNLVRSYHSMVTAMMELYTSRSCGEWHVIYAEAIKGLCIGEHYYMIRGHQVNRSRYLLWWVRQAILQCKEKMAGNDEGPQASTE